MGIGKLLKLDLGMQDWVFQPTYMDQKGQAKSKDNCNPLSQFSKQEGMHELDGYHNIFDAEKLA